MSRLSCFLIFLIGFFNFYCSDNPTKSLILPAIPQDLDDGWEVSSLASEGMNPERLAWLSTATKNNDFGSIHSILIVRNGKLIFEEYYQGYHVDRLHPLASVTKSILSILIGIAVDQGYIGSIDDPIEGFFPEYSDIFTTDSLKKTVTIRHLLTMGSGLEWDEWSYPYGNSWNSHYQMERSPDWVQFILERPLIETPGTSFTYNSGNSILLGSILKESCGLPADQWAENVLFDPLGITTYNWEQYDTGFPQTGGGLRMRPRDLAKIGYLFLNEGEWEDDQIISQDWMDQSTQVYLDIWPDVHYGHHWWLRSLPQSFGFTTAQNGIIYGVGYAGQFLFIIPDLHMLVVFTSWNVDEFADAPLILLYEFILTAVEMN
jgi:CubicO group peptidase (beta-lactamase class C family)